MYPRDRVIIEGMISTRELVLDPRSQIKISVTALPAWDLLPLYPTLAKAVGAAIKQLDLKGSVSDLGVEQVGKAIESLAESIPPDLLTKVARQLLGGEGCSISWVSEEGKILAGQFDKQANHVLAGRPVLMMRAITFAIEVNFADFFDFLPALAGKLKGNSSPASTT